MRLPGTAEWANENVAAQIAFERSFAAAAPRLMDSMSFADQLSLEARQAMPYISEAVFALGRAAELAFVTEDIHLGLEICSDLARGEKTRPNTPMQLAFYAAVASVAAAAQVEIDPEGVSVFSRYEQPRPPRYRWPYDDSVMTTIMIRRFLPAAAASLPLDKIIPVLFNLSEHVIKPQAIRALVLSLEFRALTNPQNDAPGRFERLRAIENMEDNYATRLTLMRSDTHHWEMLQPKGSLIDWTLLCVWVGIFRFDPAMADIASRPRNDAAAFIRWLATELRAPSRFF